MVMRTKRKNLLQKIAESLQEKLGKAFTDAQLSEASSQIQDETGASATTMYRARAHAKELPIKWNERAVLNLYSFDTDFLTFDILSAWTRNKYYMSHLSALYLNELIPQRPIEHFLSVEVKAHQNSGDGTITQSAVTQSFMKGARITKLFCTLKELRFNFIERANVNDVGVITKKIEIDGRPVTIRFTDIERTLLDCIIAPHYAGGVSTIIKAFDKAEIDLDKLAFYYKGFKTLYPYWQNIGFILEVAKGENLSNKWLSRFEAPKLDFYLDKNATSNWGFSKKWRVYYPKGITHGSR
jgi:predicted transcriptional regulator of viral defense system